MRVLFILTVLFILFPSLAFAQVVFSEIMYDLGSSSGNETDSGREWIEVLNSGTEQVDLTVWKLYEGTTNKKSNHGINKFQGDAILEAGVFAVVADNALEFLKDWPTYTGQLFDSVFSLNNTGEPLVLRDENSNDIDSVTYSSEWGAGGDGESLQLIDGVWGAGSPTPGVQNKNNAPPSTETTEAQSNSGDADSAEQPILGVNYGSIPLENINAIIRDRESTATIGAAALFESYTLGLKDEPLDNARYLWSFGDGSIEVGQNVLHTYRYPGEYVVSLTASSGSYSSSDKISIIAVPGGIAIRSVGNENDFYVELVNNSQFEVNLFGWIIQSGASNFTIPNNTFILPQGTITFPRDITGLLYSRWDSVVLLYPNGELANEFEDGIKEETDDEQESADWIPPLLTTPPSQPSKGANVVLDNVAVPKVKNETDPNPITINEAKSREKIIEPSGIEETNNTNQLASPITRAFEDSGEKRVPYIVWFLSVSILVFLGATAYLMLKLSSLKPHEVPSERGTTLTSAEAKLADEIEIEAIESDSEWEDESR